MKMIYLATATAATALLGGAAFAQQAQPAPAPQAGSVTGDWNGAYAPPDNKQYQETVKVPLGTAPPPAASEQAPPASATEPAPVNAPSDVGTTSAPAATSYGQSASYTVTTLTNGPVPDTPANRAKYGGPRSHAGRMTKAAGN